MADNTTRAAMGPHHSPGGSSVLVFILQAITVTVQLQFTTSQPRVHIQHTTAACILPET